jgi:hypothetical protein
VVCDNALPKAVNALKSAGFGSRSQGRKCTYAHDTTEWRASPPPSAHFHMLNITLAVMLFRRSETLPNAAPFPTSSKIILASDRSCLPGEEPGMGVGCIAPNTPCGVHPLSGLPCRGLLASVAAAQEVRRFLVVHDGLCNAVRG